MSYFEVFKKKKKLINNNILIFREELKDPHKPRIFCLQKLVEVADFNMNRTKIIWSKIWTKIKDFFSQIGCYSNRNISMFVIDSLKQLSIKFLQVKTINFFNSFYFF